MLYFVAEVLQFVLQELKHSDMFKEIYLRSDHIQGHIWSQIKATVLTQDPKTPHALMFFGFLLNLSWEGRGSDNADNTSESSLKMDTDKWKKNNEGTGCYWKNTQGGAGLQDIR